MAKHKGLGKGVGVLFSTEDEETTFFECRIENIIPNRDQPRTVFEEEELEELANSIKEHGVLQPLLVHRINDSDTYELIAGERRFRASQLANLDTVPVIVRNIDNDTTLLELALIENIQRTDLNPIEEAEAYNKLIVNCNYTQDDAAKKLGKSRSAIANLLRLLNLPDYIKKDLIHGTLSEGHARPLLRLIDNPSALQEIRTLIINKKLSVRQTEMLVKKTLSEKNPGNVKKTNYKENNELSKTYCKSLSTQLSNKIHSNVTIHQNGTRGKIEIEYYSHDDLDRVISILLND